MVTPEQCRSRSLPRMHTKLLSTNGATSMILTKRSFCLSLTMLDADLTINGSHICKGSGVSNSERPLIILGSITRIAEDEPNHTLYLTAQLAPWHTFADTYTVKFGHVTPYQHTSRFKQRGIISGASCVLTGTCDLSQSVKFDVGTGTKGKVSNIYSDSRFKLDCVNCFTTGSFTLAGHISVRILLYSCHDREANHKNRPKIGSPKHLL